MAVGIVPVWLKGSSPDSCNSLQIMNGLESLRMTSECVASICEFSVV